MILKRYCLLTLAIAQASALFAQQKVPPGFKETPGGLYCQVVVDSNQRKAKIGDVITLNLIYSTWQDSILFSTYDEEMGPVQLTISAPTVSGDPMEGFALLGEGDSAVFLMPTDSVYKDQEWPSFARKGEFIRITAAVLSLSTKEEFEAKRKEKLKMESEKESPTIEAYLSKKGMHAQKTASGLYYIIEKQGQGPKAEPGKTVVVNYTGKLFDGTVFDSSLNPGRTPFEFKLGAGQVIKGWDEGIALFNVGGKGTLIIPSAMAYGNRSVGQIPPSSVLVFDIELLDVK